MNDKYPYILWSAKVYRSLTSGCSGTPSFRRYHRELVLTPAFLSKKRWGGLPLASNIWFSHHSRASSLPAASQIPDYIEGPPPSPTYLFCSSEATEGCNRLLALRTYFVFD